MATILTLKAVVVTNSIGLPPKSALSSSICLEMPFASGFSVGPNFVSILSATYSSLQNLRAFTTFCAKAFMSAKYKYDS